jgi:catechol 2,3-dioxygenase-like lactoylglutathione lyase family enzyme
MSGVGGRVFHLNVNCSDLDTSLTFYRDTIGLSAAVHTAPERPQPGAAFGLATAQWDAWIMAGRRGLEDVVIDLLEWKVPAPSRPARRGGFERIRLGVRDDSSLASGINVDPDGVDVEVVDHDGARVAGVVVGCSDLDESRAFYRDVVGLERAGASTFCDSRGPESFSIELAPNASAGPPRVATDVGIYRLAMVTEDLDRDYELLRTAGVDPYSPPATLDMGPGLPRLRALFFPDPDGTTLELIEQPASTAPP